MSIVISSVLIVFLLMPGIIARKNFFRTDKGNLESSTWYGSIAWPLLIASGFHMLFYYCWNGWLANFELFQKYPTIDIPTAFRIVSGCQISTDLDCIGKHLWCLLGYFFCINFFSFLISLVFREFIDWTSLDQKFQLFRYKNEWFYILSAVKAKKRAGFKVGVVEVNILCEIGTSNVIYTGVVEDFYCSGNALEHMMLTGVERRLLVNTHTVGKDSEQLTLPLPDQFQPLVVSKNHSINGNFMLFKYESIKNINITYESKTKYDELFDLYDTKTGVINEFNTPEYLPYLEGHTHIILNLFPSDAETIVKTTLCYEFLDGEISEIEITENEFNEDLKLTSSGGSQLKNIYIMCTKVDTGNNEDDFQLEYEATLFDLPF